MMQGIVGQAYSEPSIQNHVCVRHVDMFNHTARILPTDCLAVTMQLSLAMLTQKARQVPVCIQGSNSHQSICCRNFYNFIYVGAASTL